MKTHLIEWKRFVRGGNTCNRCESTGETLRTVIRELNAACGSARLRLKTTRLPASRLAESNSILIDGRPLEQILPAVQVKQTDCPSCGELIGKSAQCRTVVVEGRIHEAVPAELIRSAICRAAGCCGDDCNCGCGCGQPEDRARTKKVRASGEAPCCGLQPPRSRRALKH